MFLVLTVKDDLVDKLVSIFIDKKPAQKEFLTTCQKTIEYWDEYNQLDIDKILNDGFINYLHTGVSGSVMIVDLSNLRSDDEIAGMIEYKNITEKLNREENNV